MNPILRNILAVIGGWLGGSLINMALISLGNEVFPIAGIDPNDMEAYKEVLATLGNEYYIFPFLAHALGTLFGAFIAAKIAVTHKMKFALAIGGLFLIGGILINYMLSSPMWFTLLDVIIAYIPMAFIGGRLAQKGSKK